jgi:hypothetical protein
MISKLLAQGFKVLNFHNKKMKRSDWLTRCLSPRFGERPLMEELFSAKKGFFFVIFLEKKDHHRFQWV